MESLFPTSSERYPKCSNRSSSGTVWQGADLRFDDLRPPSQRMICGLARLQLACEAIGDLETYTGAPVPATHRYRFSEALLTGQDE